MEYAKRELERYFGKVTNGAQCEIELRCDGDGRCAEEYYRIDVVAGKGYIQGADKKSVLLGVYALFRALGYRFFSPTEAGEKPVFLPKENCTVSLEWRYALRHRGLVIEGAVSKEHLAAILDWSVKNGLNTYFMQFKNSYEFLERWYEHRDNPLRESEPFNEELADEYFQDTVEKICEKHFNYHAVGHGWTCEAIQVQPKGWYVRSVDDLAPESRELLALVNGKRDFFGGVPLNTNLCYSNPIAREKITDAICAYAAQHGEVQYLHVWLADNYNNFCECDACKQKLPTDWYVTLLNELDEKLTAQGLDTKIVFLIYFDLFFAPQSEILRNPDRFVLMFAPVTRDYHESFSDVCHLDLQENLAKFQLNGNKFEVGIKNNVAFLQEWQKTFQGDSFVFDYPLMWESFKDLSGMRLSKTIHADIAGLKPLGLNGYLSCQVNRNFFPTAFPMYVIAKTCEDPTVTFEALQQDYFTREFGAHKDAVVEFLTRLSYSEVEKYLERLSTDNAAVLRDVEALTPYLDKLQTLFGAAAQDEVNGRNFQKLQFFVGHYKNVCLLIKEKINGAGKERMSEILQEAAKLIYTAEALFPYELDGRHYYVNLAAITD